MPHRVCDHEGERASGGEGDGRIGHDGEGAGADREVHGMGEGEELEGSCSAIDCDTEGRNEPGTELRGLEND